MKLNFWLLCSVFMASHAIAQTDDIYLEGISSVGKQKVAYVFLNQTKFSLKEGENLTRWKVARIGQRSIILADAKGKETELVLHNRLPIEIAEEKPAETPTTAPAAAPATMTGEKSTAHKTQENQPAGEVPDGYRKVQTPFGEVIVKDDRPNPETTIATQEKDSSKKSIASIPANPANTAPSETVAESHTTDKKDEAKEGEVRPGYRKVRTPFGDIWIEEKTPDKTNAAETLPLTK